MPFKGDTLVIDDLIQDNRGMMKALTFEKVAPLPLDLIEPINYVWDDKQPASGPPRKLRQQRLDIPLPPTLKIGEYIGSGHSGHVLSIDTSPTCANLPPLVAKFGAKGFNKFLLREAWFYDEMQTLQGEVIPWCFGFYRAFVPEGMSLVPWLADKHHRSRQSNESEEQTFEWIGSFKSEYADLVESFVEDPEHCVTVLVLERLGRPYLPLGGKDMELYAPIPEDITKDVYEAYVRISELGLFHMDVKYENILKAPAHPFPASGFNLSAETESMRRPLKCRIIDFELSRKTDFPTQRLIFDNEGFLKRLINNLPWGTIINQHT